MDRTQACIRPYRAGDLDDLYRICLLTGDAGQDATSLYRWLFDWAPGFSSFRVPARWLFVSTFGLALLTATGTDWLVTWAEGGRAAIVALATRIGIVRFVLACVLGITLYLVAVAIERLVIPWRRGETSE